MLAPALAIPVLVVYGRSCTHSHSGDGGDEELRSVRVGSGIFHTHRVRQVILTAEMMLMKNRYPFVLGPALAIYIA